MKTKAFMILIAGIVLGATAAYLLLPKTGPEGRASRLETVGTEPTPQEAGGSGQDRKVLYWRAPMDPTEIYDRPGKSKMGMDLIPVYEGQEGEGAGSIRIDGRIRQNMNLRTAPVERRDLSRTIRAHGQITYAQDRESTLNTKVHGWIERLHVETIGQQVNKGDPVLEIYSPELVTTQEEYLLALRNRDQLASSPIPSVRENADRTLEAAKRRLELWDVPSDEISRLTESKEVRRTLLLRSKSSGIVTHKTVVEGDEVRPGMDLFHIADLGEVWVEAAVFESDLAHVREGMPAEIRLDQIPGEALEGRVDFVYPYLDRKSRSNNVRIIVKNADGKLKPAMYATVSIQSPGGQDVLAVPAEAIIDSGIQKLVFVSQGEGLFEPRRVRTGLESSDGSIEVVSGLFDGEQVVVSGQFLLDSESRTREAIAKMRAAAAGRAEDEPMEVMGAMPERKATTEMTGVAIAPDKLYACPMHPGFITTDQEARCPECGMGVVPLPELEEKVDLAKVEFYTCEMHPEFLTTDSEGLCPECGMKVVKVKKR